MAGIEKWQKCAGFLVLIRPSEGGDKTIGELGGGPQNKVLKGQKVQRRASSMARETNGWTLPLYIEMEDLVVQKAKYSIKGACLTCCGWYRKINFLCGKYGIK